MTAKKRKIKKLLEKERAALLDSKSKGWNAGAKRLLVELDSRYEKWLKKNEDSFVHVDKLKAAGVTWEDLHNRKVVERKLAAYDRRTAGDKNR